MNDLIDTTEMYLRTVYELLEEGIPPLRARIAERLNQSGPTVSQTVARMERDGLLHVEKDRTITLTHEGATHARDVMRKHRLAECLLTEVIGLEWDKVHEEACRWEHVISTDVERRLVEILGAPAFSPYGNPIPGLADLGVTGKQVPFRQGVVPMAELLREGEAVEMVLARMSENVQAQRDLLQDLALLEVRPGSQLMVRLTGAVIEVETGQGRRRLPADVSELLFVEELAQ